MQHHSTPTATQQLRRDHDWEEPEEAAALAILKTAKASGLGLTQRRQLIIRLQFEINHYAKTYEMRIRASGSKVDGAGAYTLACERFLLRFAQDQSAVSS